MPVIKRSIVVPLDLCEWRDSGNPQSPNETTLRGHAALFNSLSDDLGGFREMLEPGAFRAVLRTSPDVRLLLNHDPNYVLGRTAANTLEVREDNQGLHVFARVDRNISWVEDLRRSMQRGDIDQMSFAFTVAEDGDTWAVTDDGHVVRTIRADGIDGLYDVSVVTYPAYERTTVNIRSLLDHAVERGRVPGIEPAKLVPVASPDGGASSGSPMRGSRVDVQRRLRAARIRLDNTPTRKETQ